jgi:hypothetical protein
MRMVNLAAVAVVAILAAGPALAGERGCGSRCGGGGHRPPPPPGGGFNSNINVNVNANANANAFAGASAGAYFNARAYDVGGIRGRGYGGGTVYVGGGYGGDGGYYGGGAVYNEAVHEGRTCASAPFGYVVEGFGREGRRPPACVATTVCRDNVDRGGRYGYSERRRCDDGRREGRHESYGRSGSSYESYESYEEYSRFRGEEYGYREERYDDRYRDHGYERREDYRPHVRSRPVYVQGPPVYVESPPVYVEAPRVHVRPSDVYVAPPRVHVAPSDVYVEAPNVHLAAPDVSVAPPRVHVEPPRIHQAPPVYVQQPDVHVPAPPPIHETPMTPNEYYGIGDAPPAPRQYYSQEPGERG